MTTFNDNVSKHQTPEDIWECLMSCVVEVGEMATASKMSALEMFCCYLSAHLYTIGLMLEYSTALKLRDSGSMDVIMTKEI